ncbi:hypothetical protein ACWV26_08675 [Rummeliibacillus sp. JY-2-4R]
MSEYLQVIIEIKQLEAFLNQQFSIKSIEENLDGAQVVLVNEKQQQENMLITTAEARKHLSAKLREQLSKQLQK